jgi:tripartite-type tricarboxylate transporter receptor subunit TctC
MRLSKRLLSVAPLAAVILLASALSTSAQNYPTRPIKVIVGFSPGTTTDVIARLLAQQLTQMNGWQVVVENKPGQGGSNAATEMMHVEPDGYTLSMSASGPLAVNPFVNPKLPYKPLEDFTPISQMVTQPGVLVVRKDFPAKTVQELIALEKAKPGQLNYASIGAGTGSNLMTASFLKLTGMSVVHVPYKGSPEAISSILSGDTQLMFEGLPSTIGHIQSGTLRALAVSSLRRLSQIPEVPTVDESGIKGFDMQTWIGFIGPRGLPQPITEVLSREVWRVMNTPEIEKKLYELGLTLKMQKSSAEFREFIRSEMTKWGTVVEEAGVRIQ